jgi:hypothetical protein
MATETQDATQTFEAAFPMGDEHVDPNPDAYPYTYFRIFGDSWRQAREEVAHGSASVTLKGMWIDGTFGTLTVGRDSATGAWQVQGRTPQGPGLGAVTSLPRQP